MSHIIKSKVKLFKGVASKFLCFLFTAIGKLFMNIKWAICSDANDRVIKFDASNGGLVLMGNWVKIKK